MAGQAGSLEEFLAQLLVGKFFDAVCERHAQTVCKLGVGAACLCGDFVLYFWHFVQRKLHPSSIMHPSLWPRGAGVDDLSLTRRCDSYLHASLASVEAPGGS